MVKTTKTTKRAVKSAPKKSKTVRAAAKAAPKKTAQKAVKKAANKKPKSPSQKVAVKVAPSAAAKEKKESITEQPHEPGQFTFGWILTLLAILGFILLLAWVSTDNEKKIYEDDYEKDTSSEVIEDEDYDEDSYSDSVDSDSPTINIIGN